jgi:hypothetical protein
VISDVEQCLAQRVTHRLAGHHQVKDAQDRECCGHKGLFVRVDPGEACQEAESSSHAGDRKKIENESEAVRQELLVEVAPAAPPIELDGLLDAWRTGLPTIRRELLGRLFDGLEVKDGWVVRYIPRKDR